MKKMSKAEAAQVMDLLKETFPDAGPELHFSNPFELLVATILSAQTTDVQVNKVTPALFQAYPGPAQLALASPERVMEMIKSIGFYRNKAKNIVKTAAILVEKYRGQVPDTMEELVKLPGVGRKTANVVLSNAFHQPAIAVDTHVFRVSNRIGLSQSQDVLACEKDLRRILDSEIWSLAHHLLIFQGRRICKARNPLCQECSLRDHCRFYQGALQ